MSTSKSAVSQTNCTTNLTELSLILIHGTLLTLTDCNCDSRLVISCLHLLFQLYVHVEVTKHSSEGF